MLPEPSASEVAFAAKQVLTFLSLSAIVFAYFVEIVLKHAPCNLCLIERVPYFSALFLISLFFFYGKKEKLFIFLIFLLFVFNALVSIYHVGIEQGFFEEKFCGTNFFSENPDALFESLKKAPISCKVVTFKIFGLSLATLNVILSLLLSIKLGLLMRK